MKKKINSIGDAAQKSWHETADAWGDRPPLPGYQITEQLYAGSRTLVYRAIQESNRQPVVLKLLRNEMPTFSELVKFRNQYAIMRRIGDTSKSNIISGIIQAYSLEHCGNGYVLVMEDFGGISLSQFTQKQPLEIAAFLDIALQLGDILHHLYQHRVIHKDIKPANILIHPETKQVKLIDFSISSLLPRETQEIKNPNFLEGTIAYLSPEQTGRMNRGIDYRSDFYSLGVTFFQLLAGQLPFQSDDPMELIHFHLAVPAIRVDMANPKVPAMLAQIVAKLMAKNAEDRYQSALGLKHDLEICWQQWQETGTITEFEIAQEDRCDRFIIPEKLYGRQTEVAALLAAFDRVASGKENRVANGSSQLMLVAGFSGIGKTAVINEVHKPIVRQRGYFIKGKFDQFQRNIPLGAFVQSFRDLMAQLLGESRAQIEQWRSKILQAVGENGQLIIDVIPELERIIGKQPPVPELSGSAAQNRFNLLFQNFIKVFTAKEHPLAIFLDDLQWADSASLSLLKLLLSQTETEYLLVLGAYRDNEVFPAHPLMLALEEIKKTRATINTITLTALNNADLNHLVADTLKCSTKLAQPLTDLIYQKTKGNPFFATQFLKALYNDRLIAFNPHQSLTPMSSRASSFNALNPPNGLTTFGKGGSASGWECDLAQVKAAALTSDVVEFMAAQLKKLPAKTQEFLKLAACIGNSFDLATLAIVAEKSLVDAAANLWAALQSGLILPVSETYKFFQSEVAVSTQEILVPYRFLHDRVQQAAYSLIPDDRKQATHLQIGRLLLKNTPPTERDEKIFEIVNQLNRGIELIREPAQRDELARLNFAAGSKAKAATACAAAAKYFKIAIELLGTDSWNRQYDLALNFYLAAAEAEYLNSNFARAQLLTEIALQHPKTLLEQARVYEVKIHAYIAQTQLQKAIDTGFHVLEMLGVKLETESPEIQTIQELADLPEITDPQKLAALRILDLMGRAAYITNPLLSYQVVCTEVSLCISSGNSPIATYIYAFYGLMLCGVKENFDAGYQFALLSLRLIDKFHSPEAKSIVFGLFNGYVRHWKEHIRTTLEPLKEAFSGGIDSGELIYAGYSILNYFAHLFFAGEPLNAVEQQQQYIDLLHKQKLEYHVNYARVWQQTSLNLLGCAANPAMLTGTVFDETEMLPTLSEQNNGTTLFVIYVVKSLLAYLFEEPELALASAQEAAKYQQTATGMLLTAQHNFYYSLALLANYPRTAQQEQNACLDLVVANQIKMQMWVHHAPMNFLHKWHLIEAEILRILGKKAQAMQLYDLAISGAKSNEYIQEEGLANELAAKFYLEWGIEKVASVYMQEAYYCYARWGAKAKVEDLTARYPQLLSPILQRSLLNEISPITSSINSLVSLQKTVSSTSNSISNLLDLATVLKAAQTLYSEIHIDKLLANLMQVIVENSGADKAALLLDRDGDLEIVIKYLDNAIQLLSPEPVDECEHLPTAVIHYVERTMLTVITDDAQTHPSIARDRYFTQYQPQSLLCTPILGRGKLIGVLYLENSLTTGAFTSKRVELLKFLCSQAAISLENARLYQQSQTYARQLEQSLQQLQISEARYRYLTTATSQIVWLASPQGENLDTVHWRAYTGQTEAEVKGTGWLRALHPDDLERTTQVWLQAFETKSFYETEYRIRGADGIYRYFAVRGVPVLGEDGSVKEWVGTCNDIDARKRAEDELRHKSQQLENTLQELQTMQLQLVQKEKMSALGNLVAGVAHEINNPVGFLAGNIRPALDYIQDLFGLIDLYQEKYPQPDAEIAAEIAAIDLDFLREDLPKLLVSLRTGVDRIANISTSLRTFSRADSDTPVKFNLHEGLDSTILILKHRLKANQHRPEIQIIKNYGQLPQVKCFAGQLNQVFMNILANAIDALEESHYGCSFEQIESRGIWIAITTQWLSERQAVCVRIQDNGRGISETVKDKIFDHLFTTKPVGKGTGLGLAIARQIIVEKHGGAIEVNSEIGKGTEFVICLPKI
ncbi:MAG: AAA family ATPase [Oscillatoriaceae cyanobacterium Prado104]|jgi:PAS domain S-box-containing protein|nr:AAA family ATPase [Oscillatoriaceae cyanobacterium Prado104]